MQEKCPSWKAGLPLLSILQGKNGLTSYNKSQPILVISKATLKKIPILFSNSSPPLEVQKFGNFPFIKQKIKPSSYLTSFAELTVHGWLIYFSPIQRYQKKSNSTSQNLIEVWVSVRWHNHSRRGTEFSVVHWKPKYQKTQNTKVEWTHLSNNRHNHIWRMVICCPNWNQETLDNFWVHATEFTLNRLILREQKMDFSKRFSLKRQQKGQENILGDRWKWKSYGLLDFLK